MDSFSIACSLVIILSTLLARIRRRKTKKSDEKQEVEGKKRGGENVIRIKLNQTLALETRTNMVQMKFCSRGFNFCVCGEERKKSEHPERQRENITFVKYYRKKIIETENMMCTFKSH